jgi:UDP:flavonoid glycosyltransferase YjiC (YdhE family)
MNIGYVIWSLELGGAEQVLMRLATGMRQRGHGVTIFTPGRFAPQMQAQGIAVIAMRKHGPYDLSVIWRLRRAFRASRLDVVHTHLWGAGFWGRIAAQLAGVRVVIAHEHGMQHRPQRRSALARKGV